MHLEGAESCAHLEVEDTINALPTPSEHFVQLLRLHTDKEDNRGHSSSQFA